MPGAKTTEVHRSHLPLLPQDVREGILAAAKTKPPRNSSRDDAAALRPYQRAAAEFARNRDGTILGLDCGLGKTRTSLCATYAPGKIGIIVAPLVAWSVWRKEIGVVYGSDYPIHSIRGRRLTGVDENLFEPGIYLLNPEIVNDRWSEWIAVRPTFTILDEAHLYISRKTRRREGAGMLAAVSDHRIALSGTPILRHLIDLHGILSCVCPNAFGGWYKIAMELGADHGRHGVQLGNVPAAAKRMFEQRLSEVMIRQRWEEVASDIPQMLRERLPVALSPKDAAEYNRLSSDVRKILGGRIVYDDLLKALAMMAVGALRRFIGRAKVPAVIDLGCSSGEPVVIWTWHRDVAHAIAEGIRKRDGSKVEVITGEENQKQRDERILRFQTGQCRVICATMAVAGVGIDLTAARITIFAELDWTPAVMTQAERRVWRSGQTRSCLTYWPIVAGSVEDRILDILTSKEEFAESKLLDGMTSSAAEGANLHSIVDLVDMIVT